MRKPLSKFATPAPLPRMVVIGNDLGFLNRGVDVTNTGLTIAPGERIDVVVDFTNLTGNYVLTNSAVTPFPAGTAPTGGSTQVMRFDIVLPAQRGHPGADHRQPDQHLAAHHARYARRCPPTPHCWPRRWRPRARSCLGEGLDAYGRITPLLGVYDPVNPARNLGTRWAFSGPGHRNPGAEHHRDLGILERLGRLAPGAHPPVGVPHPGPPGVQAHHAGGHGPCPTATSARRSPSRPSMVGTRVPAPATEQGPKDTVVCPPGFVTRILIGFKRPGTYVYHCHILSHEEHDMMRWFKVI